MKVDLNDLYYFVEVVDHGGFAPAGRALGITKSKLSRRIFELEERLGVRLIQRSTRHFSITDVGSRYYRHCQAMLTEALAAQQSIDEMKVEPMGTIRISCPVGLLQFHMGDFLARFLEKYPAVNLELIDTNRRVDVVAEGIDVAIRVRPLPLEDSDLVLKILSDRCQCLVASPALIAARGMPDTPQDLALLPSMDRALPEESHSWQLHHEDGRIEVVTHQPRFVTTDMASLRLAALRGVGVVQLPYLMVADDIAKGALIDVLPMWRPRPEMIHLVYPSRRGILPSVRALIDFIAEQYQQMNER